MDPIRGPGTALEGWFYINPSRRGPVPGWDLPGVPRDRESGTCPGDRSRPPQEVSEALPAQAGKIPPFPDPREGHRAPPRGVDVKATPAVPDF